MLGDIAILTGGEVISEEVGLKLENTTLDLLGRARKRRRHQGRHDDRRRCRRRGRGQGPHRPDQARDRGHRLRLGPREAPGAARQAGRRRRRHQGRRGHRGRAQGEEAPHRGRHLGHPGRYRRGHRRRRRRGPGAQPAGRRQARPASSGDEATGRPSSARALDEPLKWIAINAGFEGAVDGRRGRAREGQRGLNALTGEFEDLVKAGIIDPAKVTRSALQNAASIAALLLTTEALIADKPEKPAGPAAAGAGCGRGGMGMM